MKKKKLKKRIKVYGIIFFLLLLIVIGFNYSKLEIATDLNFNLNETVEKNDLVKKVKHGELLGKEESIDTSTLGEKNIPLQFKTIFGFKKTYKVTIQISDTEKPHISYNPIKNSKLNQEIDLTNGVSVSDNSNENIKVQVEGEYDIHKLGEYKLYYIAKDSSGNEAREEFTLNIVSDSSVSKNESYFTTSKGFQGVVRDGVTYIEDTLIVNKSYSLPSTFGNGLTNETLASFKELQAAALLDGLNIYIASGFRSYDRQVTLYDNYVKRDGKEKADTYSARPGYSEHQSGLTFDVNEVSDKFINTPEANWLSENCYKYGFILRYPNGKQDVTGFKYEAWHFRYVGKELAEKLYNNGDWLTIEEYFGIDSVYPD